MGKKHHLGQSDNSAGKNLFFECVTDSLLLVGTVKKPIRGYVFGFQDCPNKRIILWNEALVEPYFYEDVKPILSGDCPRVQIKNNADAIIPKTPVIVLSNRNTFPDNEEFNCRIVKYIWSKCELLAYYHQKPDPKVAIMLLMYLNEPHNMSQTCLELVRNQINRLENYIATLGNNILGTNKSLIYC